MKQDRSWLNIAEYLCLVGSGVGSIATVASQQILYTAAPVSVLLLLNLVNRRRIEEATYENSAAIVQVDERLSNEVGTLQKHLQALPSFLDLASLRKAVQKANQDSVAELKQEIAELKQEVAKPNWTEIQETVQQLQGHYGGLADAVLDVTNHLNRLDLAQRLGSTDDAIAQLKSELSHLRVALETSNNEPKNQNNRALQDQINHINRRLNQLPTPFDPASLRQDINSLVRAMGDMASRRELSRLVSQIEKLSQQNDDLEQTVTPLKVATNILRKQLDTLSSRLGMTSEESGQIILTAQPQVVEHLRQTVQSLERRLNEISGTRDRANLRENVQSLVAEHLEQLQQQLNQVNQVTHSLEQQQQRMQDWVNRLPQILDSGALQNQIQQLSARVEWAESTRAEVETQVDDAVKRHLEEVMEHLSLNRPTSEYELVFDVKGGRSPSKGSGGCNTPSILQQALESAEARLILVYPYPTPEVFNSNLIQQFRDFLSRQGCLDIGWGHLGSADEHLPRSIDRRRRIAPSERSFLYEILNQLTQLKRQYPDQFRFKVLGTDENFLVCDRSFAIMGAESIATASAVFPQAAVGLRTTDSEVIQQLVERFDNPLLEANDAEAYFKRALTRYDLGDRQGAIADYTEAIRITSKDAASSSEVAYNNRGLARYDLGDKRGAIGDFDLAVQQNPESFVAFCNRGFVRAELGDRMGAIEDYTFALQIHPDYAAAYFYRGLARTRMRNKLGAIQDYNEVIRLEPNNAAAYLYRGLACIKIGQRDEAIQNLQRAASLFAEQGDIANYQQTMRAWEKINPTLAIADEKPPLVSNGV